MPAYYSQPAAANYSTPPAHPQKQRGLRICDQCGQYESPAVKFRLCGGCMVTQYCSQECQKEHWPQHRPICKHTTSQMAAIKQQHAAVNYQNDENIAKNLRKFCSTHTALLSWVGFQALQLRRVPSNIRQHVLVIDLVPHSQPEAYRKFSVASTRIVKRSYIDDPLVHADIQRRDDRCRHSGGLGALVVLVQCAGISQVMPIEVDPPSKITWDNRDDWAAVLNHFVESGRTDFQPISTTSRGRVMSSPFRLSSSESSLLLTYLSHSDYQLLPYYLSHPPPVTAPAISRIAIN
ncbi:hypothetical protein D9757_012282 [Collybiopsis confluens]|uniref:MYND-type domain-containing protein n=1 Tax=Collybiopsis confluens TaxID=2823264 RepID=A0A8H5GQA9_9AGAR|nr:hypothetical protein D9757_012282 [Collybiopsis confluens]